MAQWLKQSTAVTIPAGPFPDATDGNTEEVSLTISQGDIRLSKNGGAFAQTNNAAGATHMEKGLYGVPLDTTDTGTLGRLTLHVHESGALAFKQDFMVVPANVYDSLVLGSASLTVAATGYRLSSTGVDDILDEVVDGAFTLRQLLRGFAAAMLGELSGAATTTITMRDISDTKNRVVATVDTDGNRSALTLDLT